MHQQVGLVTDGCAEGSRCCNADADEERHRVNTEFLCHSQSEWEGECRRCVVGDKLSEEVGDDKQNGQHSVGAVLCLSDSIGHGNDKVGYVIGEARVLHPFGDCKSTGNGHQYVPRHIFAVSAGIEDLCPGHNNRRQADKEKHIEFETWHQVAYKWQLTYGSTCYHKDKQQ